MSLKYRPEIDGLRSIAVLAVILYHAKFMISGVNPFQGGFVGVDVFFVISGYLITSILLREMGESRFSLRGFYERRARRILPALLVVMLVSVPFAWHLILPEALNEYAGASLSALGFGSNFWFWLEASYAAEPSMLKPLLHTWTLAVEEQFYILFPLILLALMKWKRHYIAGMFVLLLLLSLQVADAAVSSHPDATFYLLHTRMWELLAGALLAKMEVDKGRISHPFLDMVMPALGLFLIMHAIVFFEDTMRHPSFLTVLPVVGTMLLIWFGKQGELVSDILSTRLLVGIGLISYSLYLWHYPIFAFARIEIGVLTEGVKIACIALSFVMAIASYYLIERPMRFKVGFKAFATFIIVSIGILAAVNIYILKTDGAKFRMAAYDDLFDIKRVNSPLQGKECFEPRPALGAHCKFHRAGAVGTIIGIGDSHLAAMSHGLLALAEKHNMNYEQFPRCVFIANTEVLKLDNSVEENPCPEKQIAELSKYDNAIVVKVTRLTSRITGTYIEGGIEGDFTDQYVPVRGNMDGVKTIERGVALTNEKILALGHRLVQVYPVPEHNFILDIKLKSFLKGYELDYKTRLREVADTEMVTSFKAYQERNALAFKALDMVEHPNYFKVYPHNIFCDEQADICKTIHSDRLMYRDNDHVSDYGGDLIAAEIEKALSAEDAF